VITTARASEADLPAIDQLQQANGRAVGFLPLQAIRKRIACGDVLIASWAAGVVGYLLGSNSSRPSNHKGRIFQIAVSEEVRGQGVGRLLVESFLSELHRNIYEVSVWVAQDLPAMAFWTRMQFRPIAWRAPGSAKARIGVLLSRRSGWAPTSYRLEIPKKCAGGPFTSRNPRAVLPLLAGRSLDTLSADDPAMVAAMGALSQRTEDRPHSPPPPVVPAQPVWAVPPGKIGVLVAGRVVIRARGIVFRARTGDTLTVRPIP
jgi:GNAT superfamily N-acetyltransferase